MFFKLLGWKIAEDGAKAESFNTKFNFRSDLVHRISCFCRHRVEELTKEIENVLTICKLKKSAANKLRGRMQFAENQIFERLSRRCLKAVSEHPSKPVRC